MAEDLAYMTIALWQTDDVKRSESEWPASRIKNELIEADKTL